MAQRKTIRSRRLGKQIRRLRDDAQLKQEKLVKLMNADQPRQQALADTTAQRCTDLASFVLQIGWLAGSQGAIRFTALPVEIVVRARQAVREALADVSNTTTDQP